MVSNVTLAVRVETQGLWWPLLLARLAMRCCVLPRWLALPLARGLMALAVFRLGLAVEPHGRLRWTWQRVPCDVTATPRPTAA